MDLYNTLPTIATDNFHAAVWPIVEPGPQGERCDCGAIAEFMVGCVDFHGALVADVLNPVCPPHLGKAVTEAAATP